MSRCAFDAAMEFGGFSGGSAHSARLLFGAGLVKLGHEFQTAIALRAGDRQRQRGDARVEVCRCRGCGNALESSTQPEAVLDKIRDALNIGGVTNREAEMAKGQQRSNKEKRKPKKEKSAKSAPSAGAIGSGGKK